MALKIHTMEGVGSTRLQLVFSLCTFAARYQGKSIVRSSIRSSVLCTRHPKTRSVTLTRVPTKGAQGWVLWWVQHLQTGKWDIYMYKEKLDLPNWVPLGKTPLKRITWVQHSFVFTLLPHVSPKHWPCHQRACANITEVAMGEGMEVERSWEPFTAGDCVNDFCITL